MSRYKFSENKDLNVKAIREMVEYLRATFQVYTIPSVHLVDVAAIERFADQVERGEIR